MFTIKAAYKDQFEVTASIDKVREFFTNVRNFVELMPNVESINVDASGAARWTIRAEIPLIGAMTQSFEVELAEDAETRVEWIPRSGETENFLRYAADFIEKSAAQTIIQFSQAVELRRNKARDFHFLAGLAGEKAVSQGMQLEVTGMLKKFVSRTKEKLER